MNEIVPAPSLDSDAADEAFARGLALHLAHWARILGADARLADALAQLGQGLARALRRGHVCLPLAAAWQEGGATGTPPSTATLRASGVVGTATAPAACPLVIDDEDRLYLHRDFDLEQRLAQRLVRAAHTSTPPLPAHPGSHPLAGPVGDASPDWQQVAAALALRRRFVVISGGPGTGKTSTVVQVLAQLLQAQPQARMALAAPTGKAAARLAESLRARATALPAALRALLPQHASTVHRLLGVTPQGFVHHAGNPLAIDLLVVDEASMLDLALATQLFEAVPRAARIVLLGDQHQLAAVESGAVFAELAADPRLSDDCRRELEDACALAPGSLQPPAPLHAGALPDSVVWFERNYRFAAASAIGQLAAQVKSGHSSAALATLAGPHTAELQWWDDGAPQPAAAVLQHAQQGFAAYLQSVLQTADDAAALARALAGFRVLCAHRQGPRGMLSMNAALDAHAQQVLAPLRARHPVPTGSDAYPGRPVMVLRNEPLLQLFNGDVGITLPPRAGESGLVVAFVQADGSVRRIALARLPAHQSAWALTVHKAQGSEFDAVLVLLPAAASPVLTRELLYTALTRARKHVALAAAAAVVASTIDTPTRRHSGLTARLREALAAHTASPP